MKIENPLTLNHCDNDITYKNIKNSGKWSWWYGEPIGFDVVYKDTAFNYFASSYKPCIVSSFVWQNELLHIYETDTATYIAKIENDSIKTIQEIGKELNFFNWHYSYRCKNLNGNNELLKFQIKDEQLFGLMDIVDNKISVHYFVNKAELKPKSLGRTKADSIFVNRFNLFLSDFDNLQLKNIDLSEQSWETFDITPNHKIGIGTDLYPNLNNYKLDTLKSYLIEEDSLISNSIVYYTTQECDLVRVVSLDWERTRFSVFDSDKLIREAFIDKLNFLETFFYQKLGQPVHIIKETPKTYLSITWKAQKRIDSYIILFRKY